MLKKSSCFTALAVAFLIAVIVTGAAASPPASPSYAVAILPTPVFNIPDFARLFGGRDGNSLVTDECAQFRQLETVALPGAVFEVAEVLHRQTGDVYRVTTRDYPYPTTTGYFIDSRFVSLTAKRPAERKPALPSRREVIERLLLAEGSIYVWGGNVPAGIPEMLRFFAPASAGTLAPETAARWQLRGVDCSGLLYNATDGFTPRNTSSLVSYGRGVPIAGRTTTEIVSKLEPLDIIVWSGHVLIVVDRERLIESYLDCSGGGGVRVRPLARAIDDIRRKRKPLDQWDSTVKGFVIRRWYPVKGEG